LNPLENQLASQGRQWFASRSILTAKQEDYQHDDLHDPPKIPYPLHERLVLKLLAEEERPWDMSPS
jgi:hypothetical protein